MKVYDTLILGAGPAGITASVYCSRKKMDFLVITENIGGQTTWSGDIENYTSYQFITGAELTEKFKEHMKSFGAKVNIVESVKTIEKQGSLIKTTTNKAEYLSKTLIVSTGKRPRPLGVDGESKFMNKGLTYCATCDGPLFNDKNVAIIGGGNSGLEAALQLMQISPKVYIVNIADSLTGDPIMMEKVKQTSNIEVLNKSSVKKLYGDNFLKGIEVESMGKIRNIEVEGIFIEIGLIPNSSFAANLELNKKEEIIVDFANHTSVEGIFAAGDVTNVPEKQIIVACGEGSKAALSAFKYLFTHNFDN